MQIPEHVLSAFQLDGRPGTAAGPIWDNGVRFGRTVVAPANDAAAWSGKTRERIGDSGTRVRVSRPVRATDGRLVVGGFKATEFVEGEVLSRIDEAMAAALEYDTAIAGCEAPGATLTDAWSQADRAVWRGYQSGSGDVVAHLDFVSCLVTSGDMPPTLTDLVPSAAPRPRGYTAALVMVDGLLAGAVDTAVVERWAHVPDLRSLAERALEYREASARAAGSDISSNAGRVAGVVVSG